MAMAFWDLGDKALEEGGSYEVWGRVGGMDFYMAMVELPLDQEIWWR